MRTVARESFLDLKDDQQRVVSHLLDQASDAILLLDLEGRFVEANRRACDMTGYPREKLLTMGMADTSLPEEMERHRASMASVIDGAVVRDYRCGLRRTGGSVIQVEASASLVEFRGDRRILCFLRDVTAQAEAERRYRAVVDTAADAIVTADAAGTIVSWNPAAAAIFGYAAEEAVGRPLSMLMPERYRELHQAGLRRLAETGRSTLTGKTQQFHGLRRDGAEFPLELSLSTWESGGSHFVSGVLRDVSARVETELALRESEERFRQIARHLDAVFWLTNPEKTRIDYVSAAFDRIYGLPRETLLTNARAWLETVHPDDRERLAASLKLQREGSWSADFRVVHPDGTVRRLHARSFPVKNERGEVVRIAGITEDVTLRRQSELRLRAILEGSQNPVYIKDLEGRYLLMNAAGAALFNGTPQDIVGQRDADLLDGDVLRLARETDRRVVESGEPHTYSGPAHLVGPDRTYLTTKFPYRSETGEIVGVVGISHDVTDIRRTEEALRQSEQKLRAIVEHAVDPIYIKDLDGRYVTANPAAAMAFGISVPELVGRTDADFHDPETARDILEIDRRIVESGKPYTYAKPRRFPTGERAFMTTKVPYRAPDGSVIGLIGISRDITDRMRAEDELRLFRNLIDHVDDAIFVIDPPSGRILDVNQTACERLGYEREEILELAVMDVETIIPNLDAWRAHLAGLTRNEARTIEGQHRRRDGTTFPVEVSIQWVTLDRDYLLAVARDITERRLLLEHARDFVYRHNAEGIFDYLSPAVEQITGYGAAEWMKHYTTYLTDNPINQEVIDSTETALRTGVERPPYLVEIRHRQGHRVTLEVSERPFVENGRVAGIIGIARDVSDRVRTETELAFKTALLSAEHDLSPDGILVVDDRGKMMQFNQRFVEMWGLTPDVVATRSDDAAIASVLAKLVSPDEFVERVRQLYLHPEEYGHDELALRDGRTFERHSSPMTAADGRYLGRIWFFRDVTDRKSLESLLVEARRHYQELYDSAPVMLFQVAHDGRILDCNARALETLSYSRDRIVDVPFLDLFSGPSRSEARRLIRSLLKTGTLSNEKLSIRTRDGEEVIVELDATAERDLDGRVFESRVSMRDVTVREMQAQALAQARQELEVKDQMLHAEKLRALGEMLSGVAHELNNPLGAIIGFSELMLGRGGSEELRQIHDEAQRCARIVKNLLRFARRSPPEKKLVDVRRLLEDAMELRAYHFRTQGITVTRELQERLPATFADEGQLVQVFLNVVNNAEDAVAARGAAGRIDVRAWSEDEWIYVSFRDNGTGIPRDRLRQVFDPFFTTKEPGRGTGLGLSVAFGIIQDHRGRITAESEVGAGTTITIELPVRQESTRLMHRRDLPALRPPAPRRILVVEDEPSMRKLLRDVLELDRHTVLAAEDVPTALQILEREPVDLVISDIKMPGMSGRELYERLLKTQRTLARRMLFITGDMLNPPTQEFLRTTHHRVLEKPCSVETIRREVAAALSEIPAQ